YGTHSFRRGGCQYRIKIKKWSADMVAAWGGWSQVEAGNNVQIFLFTERQSRVYAGLR
ncbi:hypothetical protein C8R46DRAFT_922457, partial [Mycena filopes]